MTAPAPKRLLWLLAPVAAFAATLALLTAVQGGGGAAAPAVFDRPGPASVDVPPGASTAETIAATRAAIAEEPGDAALHATLGDLYYQRGRETADSSWNEKALTRLPTARSISTRRALRPPPAWARSRSPSTTSPAGSATASRRCALEPESVRPYAAIVDGQVELGRYADAERSLDRMVSLKPNLASYARISYFRELHGDLDGALQAMRLAVSAGGGSAENVAYVETLLGNLEFQAGHVARAGAAYSHRARARARVPARAGRARDGPGRAGRPRRSDQALRGGRRDVGRPRVPPAPARGQAGRRPPRRLRAAEIAAIRENQAIERRERRQHRRRARDLRGRPRVGRARGRARPLRGRHGAERVVGGRLQLGADQRRPRRAGAPLGEAGPAHRLARPARALPRRHGREARRRATRSRAGG